MPRIRTIKPEFFGSPDTARASYKARLLYIAMWCWADDYGVGLTNLQGLAGFAFEHDDTSANEVQSLLTEIGGSFGVVFYTVRERHYFAIPTWDEHQKTQRRAHRRNPGPDDPEAQPDQRFHQKQGLSLRTLGSSETKQGESPLGTGEHRNIGTGGTADSSAEPPRDDVEKLCKRLAFLVEKNGARKPTIGKTWRKDARLLLDADKVPFDDAMALIEWSQKDQFWKSIILNMPKFRQKFDQLKLQAGHLPRPSVGLIDHALATGDVSELIDATGVLYDFRWPNGVMPSDPDERDRVRIEFNKQWVADHRGELDARLRRSA